MPVSRRSLLQAVGVSSLLGVAGCSDRRSSQTQSNRSASEPTASRTTSPHPISNLDGSWESYRHDAANTGTTTDSGPVEWPTTRWSYTTLTGGTPVAPAAAGRRVFAVAGSGVLYARNAADGRVAWRSARTIGTTVSPVAGNGVVVGADGSQLVAHDTETGRQAWELSFDAQPVGLCLAGDRLVAAGQRVLLSVRLTDGSVVWRRSTDATVQTRPAAAGGLAVVGLAGGQLLAVDATDGADRWRREPGTLTGPPGVNDNVVVVGTDERVVGFDAADGRQTWDRRTTDPPFAAPVVGRTRAYVVSLREDVGRPTDSESSTPTAHDTLFYEATVLALSATDGTPEWQTTQRGQYNFTSGLPDGFPIVTTDRRVFVNFDGRLRAFVADTGRIVWEKSVDAVRPAVTDAVVSTGEHGIDATDGTTLWSFDAGRTIESSPAVVGDTVYVGSGDGFCYALNGRDGRPQWTRRLDSPVRAAPAVDEKTVYVGTIRDELYALDRADGSERWTVTLTGPVQPPTVVDGTVYVGDFSQTVYALDAADGSLVWEAAGDDRRFVALAVTVGDGLVYAGANGILRAFDATDGTRVWNRRYGERGRVQSPSVVGPDGLFVNIGDSLRALDREDGTERWARQTGGSNRPPVVRDGTVYAPGDNGVSAFDATDGTRQWSNPVGADLRLAVGDLVYGVGFDTPLLALDPADGSEVWQKAGYQPSTVPVVTDEYLFCGDNTGTVSALGATPE